MPENNTSFARKPTKKDKRVLRHVLSALLLRRSAMLCLSAFRDEKRDVVLVDTGHVDTGILAGAGGLASAARAVLALEQGLAVLVHLDLGDVHLGRVDAHVHGVACTQHNKLKRQENIECVRKKKGTCS